MWVRSRPLRRVSFAERVAFPGAPLVWCGLFLHHTTNGFLAGTLGVVLVVAYVVFVAWYSTLRDLTGGAAVDAGARGWAALWAVRASNVGADVGASGCFLFFLLNWCSAAWFPLLLLVTLVAHAVTEVVVRRRLRALHAYRGFWGGREPDAKDLKALQHPAPDAPHLHYAHRDTGEGAASDA